jgi:A/G-specific adenine glycosylase
MFDGVTQVERAITGGGESAPVQLRSSRNDKLAPTAASGARLDRVERALLAWHEEAERDLPWRRRRDPYAVLVSEVMLQQTQVSRVVPRFEEWMQRWPSIESLAAVSTAEVIRAWQGLGYNRRALSLQRAARVVAEDGWPEDLTQLPGVGPYTAAALGRFAFGREVLPIDVNVRRIIERSGSSFGWRSAEALMDLGATVCLARVPRCEQCPLAEACPSRGERFEPARRQSRFEGSFRQRRARALRAVAAGTGSTSIDALDREAVEALATDGLVVLVGGEAQLPA